MRSFVLNTKFVCLFVCFKEIINIQTMKKTRSVLYKQNIQNKITDITVFFYRIVSNTLGNRRFLTLKNISTFQKLCDDYVFVSFRLSFSSWFLFLWWISQCNLWLYFQIWESMSSLETLDSILNNESWVECFCSVSYDQVEVMASSLKLQWISLVKVAVHVIVKQRFHNPQPHLLWVGTAWF